MVRNQESGTLFAIPKDKEQKINSMKKWDQFFRCYAAIFSKANPSRAAKIMQYIHVIHDAANHYAFENVMTYDYIFRKKMAEKPYKSWAKTYVQLWTRTMVNPISRNQQANGNYSYSSGSQSGQKKEWREIACWHFNRNCCSKGAACRFEHRCSYCGSFSHIYPGCPKRANKRQDKEQKKGPTDAAAEPERKDFHHSK